MGDAKNKGGLSKDQVTKFVKESSEKITELSKENADHLAKIADLEAKIQELEAGSTKIAADAKSGEEHLQKLASDTANHLLSLGVIDPAAHKAFSTGLADPARAHNTIRFLGNKLAEANEEPPRMGHPGDHTLDKTAGNEEMSSLQDTNKRLREAKARAGLA